MGALGFAEEEGDVLFGDGDEAVEHSECVFEFLGEFAMLLISPGFAERGEAAMQGGHSAFEIEVESFEFLSEDAYFFGIDDCFGHVIISVRGKRVLQVYGGFYGVYCCWGGSGNKNDGRWFVMMNKFMN